MTKIYSVMRHYNSFSGGVVLVSLHTDKNKADKSAEEYRLTIPKRSRHLVTVQTQELDQDIIVVGEEVK